MYEDSDPNLGIYDMRVELPVDAPKSLHKALNNNICNKGGGGGQTTTTTSGIDPEFKPYLKRVLSDVTKKYETDVAAGPDAIVAAMTEQQKQALQDQEAAALAMQKGTGIYDTRKAEQQALAQTLGTGQGMASAGNTLGSARTQGAMAGALANRAGQYQKERQQTSQAGTALLGETGAALQAYDQARMDAPHTAASRYFGYLQNAPQQQTSTQSGGGGK